MRLHDLPTTWLRLGIAVCALAWLAALPVAEVAWAESTTPTTTSQSRPELWWEPGTDGSAFARHTSQHYELITDLPAERAEEILAELERNLLLYRDLLAVLEVPESFPQLLRVRVFAELADYQTYHRQRYDDEIGATFAYHHTSDPEEREAVGFMVAREPFLAGLRHEGFHQVFRHVIHFPPQWINEGLAEYCEAAQWCDEAQRFEARLHTGWARQLREFIGEGRRHRFIGAAELVRMSKRDWSAEAGSTYAGSWALVWLLRHELENGRDLLAHYLAALSRDASRGENERRAYKAAFEASEGFATLQTAYARFHAEVVPTPEYDAFVEAMRLVAAREYTPALSLLDGVIEADASFYPAYYFRGVVHRTLDQNRAALADALTALAIFPQYTSALRLAVPLALESQQFDLAAHLATQLSLVSERFRPQARMWHTQINHARKRHEAAGEAAPAPLPLPCATGWTALEEELSGVD